MANFQIFRTLVIKLKTKIDSICSVINQYLNALSFALGLRAGSTVPNSKKLWGRNITKNITRCLIPGSVPQEYKRENKLWHVSLPFTRTSKRLKGNQRCCTLKVTFILDPKNLPCQIMFFILLALLPSINRSRLNIM